MLCDFGLDIDECDPQTPFHDCVAMATCKNTDESFECVCPNGFEGNGRTNGSGCSGIDFELLVYYIVWLIACRKRAEVLSKDFRLGIKRLYIKVLIQLT